MYRVALVLWMAPAAHAGTDISCGATITQSVTLGRNLVCPGTAFTATNGPGVTPPRITVDLGGHTVSTTGTTSAVVLVGRSITLQNGRIH